MCKELLFHGIFDVPSVLSAYIAVLLSQLFEPNLLCRCVIRAGVDYILLYSWVGVNGVLSDLNWVLKYCNIRIISYSFIF